MVLWYQLILVYSWISLVYFCYCLVCKAQHLVVISLKSVLMDSALPFILGQWPLLLTLGVLYSHDTVHGSQSGCLYSWWFCCPAQILFTGTPNFCLQGYSECGMLRDSQRPSTQGNCFWKLVNLSSLSSWLTDNDWQGYRSLGFLDSSVVQNPPASAGDTGSIPRSGRSLGEGNSNPLQCFCMGSPTDRGAWRATVHGFAKELERTWQQITATTET